MKFSRSRGAFAAVFLVLQAIAGCGDATSPADSAASVTLSQQVATLVPNASITLDATVRNVNGIIVERPVTWTSSDNSKATVSQDGDVTGHSVGSATITATRDGATAKATITIKEGAIVGNEGGSLEALAGRVGLSVPSGALTSELMITVESADNIPNDPKLLSNTAIELTPDGETFSTPFQLTIKYGGIQIPAGVVEEDLRIHRLTGGSWQLVPGGEINTATKSVSANITGFSRYALLPRGGLLLSTNSLALEAIQGSNAATAQIHIANSGYGVLSGLALGSVDYPTGATGWIQSATLSSTTGPATLSLQANSTGLPPGSYQASIPINASGTAAKTLAVTLTVSLSPRCAAANAPAILPGGSVNAFLETIDCEMIVADLPGNHYVDYYKFTLAAETQVTIDLSGSFDTYLTLHHFSSGALIDSNDDIEVGENLNSRITRVLPAGTYLVAVTSFNELTTGAYQLSVTGGTGDDR